MCRLLYLIRHGEPDFKDGIRLCVGDGTDIGLGCEGIVQAKNLKPALSGIPVYTSPLKRALGTAELATDLTPVILDGFKEMRLGAFEGLTFEEIAEKYPEIYKRRGQDWSYPPPGAEEYSSAQKRAEAALESIKDGEAAVITHDGIIRALLVKYSGLDPKKDPMPRQPYGSISVLKKDGGEYIFTATGKLPGELPGEDEIREIKNALNVNADVSAHMEAVAEKASEYAEKLNAKGFNIDVDLVRTAARLHDICRNDGRNHPQNARSFLAERGYLILGNVISKHHDLCFGGDIDEAALVYLADKYTDKDKYVSLDERFAKSLEKCRTREAKANHKRRREVAVEIERKINSIL